MAKPDQIAAIRAANGVELDPDAYTAKQLEALEGLAEKDKTDLTAFNAKRQEFDDAKAAATPAPAAATPPAQDDPQVKKVSVRVSDAIAGYGGEFTDPDTGATIGAEPSSVPLTAFVRAHLRSEELVEAE
ncbi:hypothetical protein [Deinococcus sp. QL22]|uniref:hypothetical protein n=1 Tax=Deinococcus sp. QL22 TaxID=2939437 RepID=UPI002016AEDE|nr:hypothetical protein [Deinococcus sp. QL22]UQN05467.1 hypothetical protein M1R55_11335 [Deinococcus sp. QL22]